MVAHYESYNFVPKKTKGTVQIVPDYQNKWPRWTDYWFYHRVRSDEDVTDALMNELPKAHILMLEMTPMEGFRLAEILADGPRSTEVANAFALTSRWHISRDLMEEWVACNSPPLSLETKFSNVVRRDGYVVSTSWNCAFRSASVQL